MAAVTAREQYLRIKTLKDLFLIKVGHRSYCRVLFSYLAHEKDTSQKVNDSYFGLDSSHNEAKNLSKKVPRKSEQLFNCYSLSSKNIKIAELLINKLQAKPKYIVNEIWKHPKKRFISICEVKKSLQFLLDEGFSKKVITNSAALCFYPRENIQHGFEEIKRNESELNKTGLVNGFLHKDVADCHYDIELCDKRLELCLYYIELPFAFNGSGIFHTV